MGDFESILVIEGLCKSINGNRILENISFKVGRHETLVVMGRSGIGKSVLLKTIVRLMEPDKGRVVIDGIDVTSIDYRSLGEVRKNIGFLFQGGALFDFMNVKENLLFVLKYVGNITGKKAEVKIKQTLDMVGLPYSTVDKMPSELSGGMKKRVALARSIITNPKLLLLDEPTTGLDLVTTEYVIQSISILKEYTKLPMVIVTHDFNVMQELGDRVILLESGSIVFEGSVSDVFKTDNHYVDQFVRGILEGPIKVG